MDDWIWTESGCEESSITTLKVFFLIKIYNLYTQTRTGYQQQQDKVDKKFIKKKKLFDFSMFFFFQFQVKQTKKKFHWKISSIHKSDGGGW